MRVALIGGGFIAQATALRLTDSGHDVTVIAPAVEPHMASPGIAGSIAAYALDPVATPGVLRDTPRLLFDRDSPLALHRPSALTLAPWLARFLWSARPARVNAIRDTLADLLSDAVPLWLALGQRLGMGAQMQRGTAWYAYRTAAQVENARRDLTARTDRGCALTWLDAAGLQSHHPGLPDGLFAGGAGFDGTWWLTDPAAMLRALIDQTPAQRIDARVTALEPQGQRWRVIHDAGHVDADIAIVCAGAWSARLLRPLGLRLPLTAERGYHLEFDMPRADQPLQEPLCPVDAGFYFTPMEGRLRVAGTVELGGIGAPASPHRWAVLERGARAIFPDLPPVSRRWMGLRPSLPDSLPAVGFVRPGLMIAAGHGHIGMTLAPRTAALIDTALGQDATVANSMPAALSPQRFWPLTLRSGQRP